MTRLIRGQVVALFALVTTLVVTLAACGGGSSSAGGGSGGAGGTVAGTVDNGIASVYPAAQQPLFTALADIFIEPARADGVAGVTVDLIDGTGAVVATQITDSDGDFMFTGLAPGAYSIRLSQGGAVLGQTPPVQIDPNTRTELEVSLAGTVTSIEVNAEGDTISGGIEDDASSDDDDSSADGASLDDDSLDDDSSDGLSDDDSSGSTGDSTV